MHRIYNKKCNIVAFFIIFIKLFLIFNVCTSFGFNVPEIDTQKFPIEIQAEYLEYRSKANQVVVKGNAFISYKDMQLSGDTIQANTKTEDIFAFGNVEFWKGYDKTTGDFLVYNMKTGKGWMRNASIQRNRNYFKAKDVYVSPAYSFAEDVMQTTCDNYDHPHYRIKARRIEIIPNKQMTMENLALKWKGKIIYKKAVDKSSLFRRDAKFFSTRQGVSGIDGYFFKIYTDIKLSQSVSGKFGLDILQKRGIGYSFYGSYSTKTRGSGSISFYRIDEYRYDHVNTQINITNNYRFSSGYSMSTSIAYTGDKQGNQPENQDLNLQLNLTPVLPVVSMNVNFSKFFDIDGNKYKLDDNYQILNRVPEINFSFPSYNFKILPITMGLSGMYGRYEEGSLNDYKITEKKDIRTNFTTPNVYVNRRFQFTPSYSFSKSWYEMGNERENTNLIVRATHKFSNMTNLEFNYNLSTQRGKSPLRFDLDSTLDIKSFQLRIATSTWTFNPINFSYNNTTKRLEQIYWDYSRRSDQDSYRKWEIFIRRDYIAKPEPFSKVSVGDIIPSNLNVRYRLSGNYWSIDSSITYPHEYRRITNTSVNYKTIIRPYWEISTNAYYNHLNKKLSPFSINLIRDLHCWEARAEYNHERKEFWIEFYLKAYPEDTGRFRYGIETKKLETKIAAYDQLTQKYGYNK